jgi:hypothetical protein
MQSFDNYYFDEDIIQESPLNSFLNLFRKTKKAPLSFFWMGDLTQIDESTYKNIVKRLTSLYSRIRPKKDKTLRISQFKRGYFELGGQGKINKVLGKVSFQSKDDPNIPVYQFSNGGVIVLYDFKLKDEDERVYAISGNRKGREAIEQIEAKTFKDFIHASEPMSVSKNKTTKSNISKEMKPSQVFGSSDDEDSNDIYQVRFREPEEPEDKYMVTPSTKDNNSLMGLLDIPFDKFKDIIRIWGDGRTGGIIKSLNYPFKGKFTRTSVSNNLGHGYKYSDGKNAVYLMDLDGDDNTWALMIFDGKDSFNWANRNDMLSFWTSTKDSQNKIDWKIINLDNMPEGVQR